MTSVDDMVASGRGQGVLFRADTWARKRNCWGLNRSVDHNPNNLQMLGCSYQLVMMVTRLDRHHPKKKSVYLQTQLGENTLYELLLVGVPDNRKPVSLFLFLRKEIARSLCL